MLRELINLPTNHPFIHEQFMSWNFSVQLSIVNPFGRIEADKVIEITINKDSNVLDDGKDSVQKLILLLDGLKMLPTGLR